MKDMDTAEGRMAPIRIGYLCVIVALAIAVATIGCMAVIGACEEDARYFSDATMPRLFAIGIAVAIAVSFVPLFIFKKELPLNFDLSGYDIKTARFSNLLPALLSLYAAFFALTDEVLGQWGNAVLICSLITALFFALKIFPRFTVPKVISGFGVFVLGAVIIASLYLDHVIEINSHFKLLVQFGAAGMILGTMADLRVELSARTPDGSKLPDSQFSKIGVKGYVFLKSLSLTLCLVCSAAVIIYFAKGNTAFGLHYLAYSLLYVSCALSALTELIVTVLSVTKVHI